MIENRDAATETERTLRALAGARGALRARGVDHLFLVGSVARGEGHGNSDVDVLAEFAPDARPSAVTLGGVQALLEDLLGRPVDVLEAHGLRPDIRDALQRDRLAAF